MLENVSAKFPYESKYIKVLGSNLHYIDEGEGDPILFLHGVPTSSYLWRNIIPAFTGKARTLSVDLIGFGKSDKPDIKYSIFDHIKYIEAFINALDLTNITLVMHGWGSLAGFDFATRHPERIKAVAFYESHVRPPNSRDMISLPVQDLASAFERPDGGYNVIMNTNYYMDKIFPSSILRRLTDEETAIYQAPFEGKDARRPIWQYLQELPLGDETTEVTELMANYSQKLCELEFPKLMLYAIPGFITTIDTIIWARDHLKNLQIVDIGDALHYAQESNPSAMTDALISWYTSLEEAVHHVA